MSFLYIMFDVEFYVYISNTALLFVLYMRCNTSHYIFNALSTHFYTILLCWEEREDVAGVGGGGGMRGGGDEESGREERGERRQMGEVCAGDG